MRLAAAACVSWILAVNRVSGRAAVVSPASHVGIKDGDTSRYLYYGPQSDDVSARGKAVFAMGSKLCHHQQARRRSTVIHSSTSHENITGAIVVLNMIEAKCKLQDVYLLLSRANAAGAIVLEFCSPPQGLFNHKTWDKRGLEKPMMMVAMHGLGDEADGYFGAARAWFETIESGIELKLQISAPHNHVNEDSKNSWWYTAFYRVLPALGCLLTAYAALRELHNYSRDQWSSVGFVVCSIEAPSILVIGAVCAGGADMFIPEPIYNLLSKPPSYPPRPDQSWTCRS